MCDSMAGIWLEPMETGAAAQRLRAALFAADNPGRVSDAFSGPDGAASVGEGALHRRILELVSPGAVP
jgi:hypothetical protein